MRILESINLDSGIRFDVFLSVAPIVGHRPRTEIYVIAHDTRSPRAFEELWKSALTRLIDAQCCDERLAVERRNVCTVGHEGCTLNHNRPIVGQEQTLASRERPDIPSDSCLSQSLGQVRKPSHLGPNRCSP